MLCAFRQCTRNGSSLVCVWTLYQPFLQFSSKGMMNEQEMLKFQDFQHEVYVMRWHSRFSLHLSIYRSIYIYIYICIYISLPLPLSLGDISLLLLSHLRVFFQPLEPSQLSAAARHHDRASAPHHYGNGAVRCVMEMNDYDMDEKSWLDSASLWKWHFTRRYVNTIYVDIYKTSSRLVAARSSPSRFLTGTTLRGASAGDLYHFMHRTVKNTADEDSDGSQVQREEQRDTVSSLPFAIPLSSSSSPQSNSSRTPLDRIASVKRMVTEVEFPWPLRLRIGMCVCICMYVCMCKACYVMFGHREQRTTRRDKF